MQFAVFGLFGKLVEDGGDVDESSAVFSEDGFDFGEGAVAVIGSDLDEDSEAAGAVGGVEFLGEGGGGFVSGAFDGAFDIIIWHIGGLGFVDSESEGGVGGGIGAVSSGNGNHVADFGEDFAAFSVNDGLLSFSRRPFTMSCHKKSIAYFGEI